MDPSADEDDDGKTRPYEGYNYTRCRNVVKLVKPDDKDADEKARAARPDAFVDGKPFYIRGGPAQPAKKPVKPEEKDADEEDDEEVQPAASAQLAKLEDRRIHLMQVRKAAEARSSKTRQRNRYVAANFPNGGQIPESTD